LLRAAHRPLDFWHRPLSTRSMPCLPRCNSALFSTTTGREYAVAAVLGLSPAELLAFTRNAVRASFAPAEDRANLLAELNG
jgi:hypothetical protein